MLIRQKLDTCTEAGGSLRPHGQVHFGQAGQVREGLTEGAPEQRRFEDESRFPDRYGMGREYRRNTHSCESKLYTGLF